MASPTARTPWRAALATLALACLACALVPASAAAAAPTLPLRPALATGPLGTVRLSDERTLSRWASARYETGIRRFPSATSLELAKLRYMTEDGYPEVYLVLRSLVDTAGTTWLQIRIPGRPNGRVGWVPEERMGELTMVTTFLHVRTGRDATLRRGGRVIWRAPVGTGSRATPTPLGNHWIREKFPAGGGTYGPYAFGTSAYSVLSDWPRGGVVGIHGTNQPALVPGRPSHGCIRVRNAAVIRLYRLLPVGTPMLVT